MPKCSFAGTSLVERMRSTTFALLGVTAAIGLGLVAILSQQGWPLLPAVPLPGAAVGQEEVGDATTVATPSASPPLTQPQPRLRPGADGPVTNPPAAPGERADSHLSGSHQLVAASPPPANPPQSTPAGQEASPQPSPQPPSEAPAAAPVPAAAPAAVPAPAAAAPAAVSSPEPAAAGAATEKDKAYGKYKAKPEKAKPEKSYPAESPPPAPTAAPEDPEQSAEARGYLPEEASPGYGKSRGHGYGRFGR
jgi:hypothetical protein